MSSVVSRPWSGLLLVVLLAIAVTSAPAARAQGANVLSPSTPTLSWTGFGGPAASPGGEDTCAAALNNCHVFSFTVAPGDYTGKRVRFRISWTNQLNDYDVYAHQGDANGPELQHAGDPPPETVEENTFDLNRHVIQGQLDTFAIRTVYYLVGPGDAFQGSVSLEDIPVTAATERTASYVVGDKTGIKFSRSRTLYAPSAGQDVEPSVRVDYTGRAYVGGIRGLTGGNDIWVFDLNPSSPTYDPFLRAGTPVFARDGSVHNPAYRGQPDALSPNDSSELGADGGGDLDIAVGHTPSARAQPGDPPLVAFSSLVAANVSTQRSHDAAENYDRNPAGNTTVPVDDRQWLEFLGGDVVYLGYRELAGLQATSKYYVNRSDDGGLTFGPAVLAAVSGNITGNIDVDQRDGTVYFCHQGDGTEGNKEVRVAIGQPPSLLVPPLLYNTVVAAKGRNSIGYLFPVCKVANDGTAYVAYSDGGSAIWITHSTDQGRTWALPVRVSQMQAGSSALMPWIETGNQPGSLAVVWYGAEPSTNEGGATGNTRASNWRVYYALTLNATSSAPTFRQTIASDHVIHGADISVLGLTGNSPNRNLADFFQVAIDPQGMGVIAFADDSNDFAGHTYVTRQIAGPSVHSGKGVKTPGKDPGITIDPTLPEVMDWRQDARVDARPPQHPAVDLPVDIISIDYFCEAGLTSTVLGATMTLSGLDAVYPLGLWRMNFASHPSVPGVSDRGDQWFIQATTAEDGTRTYSYGTAVRNTDGSITYTVRGPADYGVFDLTRGTVTVKVDVAKLNALQTRGAIGPGTTLIGLRGSASVARFSASVAGVGAGVGLLDSTRGGTAFTVRECR